METPQFGLGQRVAHRRVSSITGIITGIVDRFDHPGAPGWFYIIEIDGKPGRPEWSRTFAERVLEPLE
jgi:hypothetical protein